MQQSRREFMQKIGAGAALAAFAPVAACSYGKKNQKENGLPPVHTDVIVVGAGASGIPAAIAAARYGAKVMLIEEDPVPGGAAVDMYVDMLCGGPRLGIYKEMIQILNQKHTLTNKYKPDFGEDGANGKNHWYLPSSFLAVNCQMIAAEKNITLLCGVPVNDVIIEEKDNKTIVKGVWVKSNKGIMPVYAPVTIDATGTGLIAELAGAEVMYGRDGRATFNESIGSEEKDNQVQRCTWMYISQRLDPAAVLPLKELNNKGMVEDDLNTWVKEWHVDRRAGVYLHWGATVICRDTRDPAAIADAQREALDILIPDLETLHRSGFLVHLAPKLGVRETRRIKGDYVLTVDDLKQGLYADDTIAHSSYGVDAWGENFKSEDARIKPYGIPYRCLLPLGIEGLLIAGKSISASHLATSAIRVQPIVASIGQAAGVAAAIASLNKTQIRNIDMKSYLQIIKKQGLFDKKVE